LRSVVLARRQRASAQTQIHADLLKNLLK